MINKNTPKEESTTDTKITIQIPYLLSSKSLGTFIPYKLAIKVGIIKIIDIEVICFIIVFILLEITEAYASMVPVKISL